MYLKLFTNFRDLIAVFRDISSEDLVEYWGVEVADEGKVAEWIRLVVLHSKSVQTNRFHRVNEILEVLMKTVSN